MAEYREIQGTAVQSLANNTGTIEGQIWYDTTNNKFKVESVGTEMTLQKLTNRSIHLYMNDNNYKDIIETTDDLTVSGSNF